MDSVEHETEQAHSIAVESLVCLEKSKVFMCEYCSRTFSKQGSLRNHLRVHSCDAVTAEFQCDSVDCYRTFCDKDVLRRHKLKHLGIRPYVCDQCQRHFSSSVALREHVARHSDVRLYTCDVCSRSFRHRSVLSRHLHIHSNERRFKCDICQQSFSQAAYLCSHMRRHTGEAPFECSICQKRFKHASDKTRHMSVHSGEKRYSCGLCSAHFKDPSSCRRHVREHSTIGHFQCPVCSVCLKRSNQLKKHLVKHGTTAASNLSGQPVDVTVHPVTVHPVILHPVDVTLQPFSVTVSAVKSDICSDSSATNNIALKTERVAVDSSASGGTENQLVVDDLMSQQNNACSFFQTVERKAMPDIFVLTSGGNSRNNIQYALVTAAENSFIPAINDGLTVTSFMDAKTTPKSTAGKLTYPVATDSNANSDDLTLQLSVEDSTASMQQSPLATITEINSTGLAALLESRPGISDPDYILWHGKFKDAVSAMPLPLAADVLRTVGQVWISLITDLTESNSLVVVPSDYCRLIRQLSGVVDSHFSFLSGDVNSCL